MAYVYIHTREDKNEVFYVGISTDKNYKRAYNKHLRSKFWKNLTKNIPYQVTIMHDNVSWEEACSIEIDLILKYGRKDLGTGTLVNTTDGGEGQSNPSQETRDRMSLVKKDKPLSKNHIKNIKESLKTKHGTRGKTRKDRHKSIICYDKEGNYIDTFESVTSASKSLKICIPYISSNLTGKYKFVKGYKFYYSKNLVNI